MAIKKVNDLAKQSKAIFDDYYRLSSTPSGVVPPKENYSNLKRFVMEDEEVRGFIGDIVDALIAAGYKLKGFETNIKKDEIRLQKLRFNQKLKNIYFHALAWQHVFVETVKGKHTSEIVEINILPTDKIKPILNKHSVVEGYMMENPLGGKNITWDADEIVHISVDHITDEFWTYPILKTLERLILLKWEIFNHLAWLFSTNQFRTHFHAVGLGDEDVKSFTDLMREGMRQKDKFLITIGREKMEGKQIADPADIPHYIELLNKLRNMMLSLIRIPPIIAGTVDNSNRSNSDIQARFAFANRIKSVQKDLEDEFNFGLLPRLKVKSKIKHNTVDIKNDKELVEIAVLLVNIGADKDKINVWLQDKGLDLPSNLFPKELGDKNGLPQNSNLFPSRKPQDNMGKSDFGIKQRMG